MLSADRIYASLLPFVDLSYDGIHENPLHPYQAKKIIELSFMRIIAAWEEFVQNIFIRYMLGATSESGYSPELRISNCKSLQHAYELISGKNDFDPSVYYLDWSTWPKVIRKAKIFFERAEPFSKLNENQMQLLKDSIIIRNRIVHSSYKSKKAFIKLSKKYLALNQNDPLPRGFSVGRLLLTGNVRCFNRDCTSDNYYQSFSMLFHKLADVIAP